MRRHLVVILTFLMIHTAAAIAQAAPRAVLSGQPLTFRDAQPIENRSLDCQAGWDGNTRTVAMKSHSTGAKGNVIEVHFIDVGQADAIYISLPGNDDILIDAGNEADGPTVVNYLKSRSVDDIDLLIATHPHEDHIGGLPAVLDAFKIERIIDSGASARSDIYTRYSAGKAAAGARYEPDNYQTVTFGNTALQILTGPETWEDANDYSVVCRLDTGEIEFLFTGDAEGPSEAALKGQLDAEILKVGHHGSLTSTSSGFLNKVKPEVAIISVGAGNRYEHPAPETVQRIKNAGITVYRTDTNGNIVVSVDGNKYSVGASRRGPVETPPLQVLPQTKPQVQPSSKPPQATATEGRMWGVLSRIRVCGLGLSPAGRAGRVRGQVMVRRLLDSRGFNVR